MRAGAFTDDYLDLDGECWCVLDTSVGCTAFCGVCTGYATYDAGWRGDRISFPSFLTVTDGRLYMLPASNAYRETMVWRRFYDKFVDGKGVGDEVPYTGWMLLLNDTYFVHEMESVIGAPRVLEVRFEKGRLVERSVPTRDLVALERLEEATRPYKDHESWLKAKRELQLAIRATLRGRYNCTERDDFEIAKNLKWGYAKHESDYDCATCSKLRDNEILPIKKSKRPRKKRYRENGYIVPGHLPQWVHDMAERQGLGT